MKKSEKWKDLRVQHFEGDKPVELLQRYLATDASGPVFTGALFNSWAGGGALHPDVVTADDLIAVQLMSMRPFSKTIWRILEGQRPAISAALSRVPLGATLWEEPEQVAEHLVAATAAWQTLRDIPGAGWVTAGKILARKRPDLVPVYDTVVRRVIGGGAFWSPLHEWLRETPAGDGLSNRELLQDIRTRAGATPAQVPDLRVFDVVLWMAGRGGKPMKTAAERDPAEADPGAELPGVGPV